MVELPCVSVLPTGREAAASARVVGLGAPLSVRVRLAACEVPLAREELLRLLAEERADRSPGVLAPGVTDPVTAALEAMLDQFAVADDDDGGVEVLWPTSLADQVLRGALERALGEVVAVAHAPRELAALSDALVAAQVALQTLRAFQTVDRGGLEDVI